jgi:hypothetical protein
VARLTWRHASAALNRAARNHRDRGEAELPSQRIFQALVLTLDHGASPPSLVVCVSTAAAAAADPVLCAQESLVRTVAWTAVHVAASLLWTVSPAMVYTAQQRRLALCFLASAAAATFDGALVVISCRLCTGRGCLVAASVCTGSCARLNRRRCGVVGEVEATVGGCMSAQPR